MSSCWLVWTGLYLSCNAILVIGMLHWDQKGAIDFLCGNGAQHYVELAEVPLETLLFCMDMACAIQIMINCIALLRGALLARRSSLVFWLWTHAFLLAFYLVYLLAGTLVYSIVRDETKVLLLLYGLVNVLISALTWKLVFDYVKDLDRESVISR